MTDDGTVQLLTSWLGFEAHDNSWEDFTPLFEDVPVLVQNFVSQHAGEDERLDEALAALV